MRETFRSDFTHHARDAPAAMAGCYTILTLIL